MNILELDSYNLDDAVKFNQRLNPKLWGADEHLLPEVQQRLMEIAEDFREFLGVTDLQLKDITVSGSNAAYTYTPHSDIDLHLVVDLPEADASEVYRELFDAKKYQYNDMHNIKIGGYAVELYVQDANKPHHSQGIYSVVNNEWIDVPKRRKPTVDDISTQSKYQDLSNRIDVAIESDDFATITAMTAKIRDMRQAGLDQHGEFGPENLAFKMLRTQGKIKQLYDARNAAKDRELSLRERKQPHSVFTYGFKHEEAVPAMVEAEVDVPAPTDEEILKDFIRFCVAELQIEQMPVVKLRRDPQWSVINRTFGRYINDTRTLEVAFGQRHIMDVLRTVAHELTHKQQHEREAMPDDAGKTGSPYENEANAQAGVLMRDYGQQHPELFDTGEVELGEGASGYIPTRAQAKDPRYSMALTVDIKPGQVGKEANKLKLRTDKQGHPQIAKPNGLFEKLMMEFTKVKNKDLDKPTPTVDAIAKKHKVDVDYIKKQLTQGIKVEREHTTHDSIAREIALDHLNEKPDYYIKLKKVEINEEQLDEVRMAPSNLMQWAQSPEAEGVRAGFEAELIFRDTTSGDDSGDDYEPDMDADERCYSISQIIEFFGSGESYMSQRQLDRLQDNLDEKYMEWRDEEMYRSWQDERDELIREAWLEERPMSERIHDALVDGLELDDKEADAVEQLHGQREKGEITGSEMSEEQLEMASQYSQARSIADDILDEEVEQTLEKEDGFYDNVLDEFRDGFDMSDDSGFFSDVGLRYMSDVSSEFDLEWPYMTSGGDNGGTRDWDSIGDSLQDIVDMPVKVSSGYHNAKRKEGQFIVEPDSSLQPDDREDYGLEIVSPPMPLLTALEKLQEVTDWANSDEGNAYTNDSTGLHMGVSVPFKGGDVDYLKLILFLGDEYVLKSFGREANTYTASAMKKLKQNIGNSNSAYRADVEGTMQLMRNNLIEFAQREIQKGVGESKYTSVHIQKGYIEFRSAGGDWLAEERADPDKLKNTMLRYARAMSLAANPATERREYAKKLYKLIAPEGDSELALFSQYSAGELTAEQLKKRWAEKTLGKESNTNKRWKLYQFDKYADDWTPVPSAEWNGYTEEQVKNAVWKKYGREALDSGEYKLVNMSEDQQWEIYDVKTDQTLEIVKAKNKGEAADAVFDKYAEQNIGVKARPYTDPATATPRAKLAKRIATPKPEVQDTDIDVAQNFSAQSTNPRPTVQDPNQVRMPNGVLVWDIYDRQSGHALHTIADHTQREAMAQAQAWLQGMNAEDPSLFGVRPKMLQPGERNLSAPQDGSLEEGWKSAVATAATAGALALGAAGDAGAKTIGKPAHKPVPMSVQAQMSPVEKLKTAASANGIRGVELAQFLAQCAHESANFTRMEEIGNPAYFAKKYDPKYAPKTAKILGNTKLGDGERYKGRGFIQLTGRDNYRRAGKDLHIPLEEQPELAARPDVAAVVAVWYWKNRVANKVSNFHNTSQVTKKINPAQKGLADRKDKFKQFQVSKK